MKKLSRSFLIVGGVLAIIGFFTFLLFGGIFIYASKGISDSYIMEAFQDIWDRVRGLTDEEKIETIRNLMRNIGIIVLVASIFSIPSMILCFTASAKQSQGVLIATIVFNAICGSVFGILGAIFGLINQSRERNAQLAKPQEPTIE